MPKKKKKKKSARVKRRNPYALIARWRSGAGSHGHPAKEASRRACRGRVNIEDYLEEEDHE